MWKATIGLKPAVPPKPNADDDWETDPDFINDVSEKQSRWGAKTVEGSGHQESIRLDHLREQVLKSDCELKKKQLENMPKPSAGYGGKFGLEANKDANALGWDEKQKSEPHASQKDYKQGFGGQFGIQNVQDKSATGWEERQKLELHESQKDYKQGFGGKFGLQKVQDKNATGWEEREKLELHESQKDYKQGFGGKFGIQKVQDKSASGWDEKSEKPQQPSKEAIPRANASDLRNKFEHLSTQNKDDKVQLERERRKKEDEELRKRNEDAERLRQQNEPAQVKQAQPNVKEEIPRANASNLRNKFEQMAAQQTNSKVNEERQRRKQEDEELRRRNEEEERLRQQQIEQQHAQMAEAEAYEQPVEKRVPASSRPSVPMSVRLPIAPQSIEPSCQNGGLEDLHHETYETVPAEPEPNVDASRNHVGLPSNALPFKSPIRRHHSSTTDDDAKSDDAAWDDTPEPTTFQLPSVKASAFPEEPTEPTPTAHSSNMNNVFVVNSPQLAPTYDFVPEPPTQSQSQLSSNHNPPADTYDYVPDEPPAMQAALVMNDLYEQPPVEVQPSVPQSNSTNGLTAIALYEYEKQDDDEIGFNVNDVISNIEQIDAGWWRGYCKGRYGLFPSNYVQLQ